MSDKSLKVLAVVGSQRGKSVTRVVVQEVAEKLSANGCAVDLLDLGKEPLPLYSPDHAAAAPGFAAL